MNSPKIRFKGYTEDWEQRKLDDVTVKIGSGKDPFGKGKMLMLMQEFHLSDRRM